MQSGSTPTLALRTQTSVPSAPAICPEPAGLFRTTAPIDDLKVTVSGPPSTEVVSATLPANKLSFTKLKTWVIRVPHENLSKETSSIKNNKSNIRSRENFELDLDATPLRNGLRQLVEDTKEKLMAVRKVTAHAFSKGGWFGSSSFLKLRRQVEAQVHIPAPAQMPQPNLTLANSEECFEANAIAVERELRGAVAEQGARREAAEAAADELRAAMAEQRARREAAEAVADELRASVAEQRVQREAAEAAADELRAAVAEQGARREAAEAVADELRAAVAEQRVQREAAEAAAAQLRAAVAEQGARREAAEAAADELRATVVKLEEQVQYGKEQITRCGALEGRFANVQKSMKLYRFQSRRLMRLLKQARGQALDVIEEDIYLNDEDDVRMAQLMNGFEEPLQTATIPAPFQPAIAPAATQPTTPTKLAGRPHSSCKHSSQPTVSIPVTSGIRDAFMEVFGSRLCGQASIVAPSKTVFEKLLEAAAGQPSYR